MVEFRLLNYADAHGHARPAIATGGDRLIDLRGALPGVPWAESTLAVLGAWDEALPALHDLAGRAPADAPALAGVRLLAPLLYPPAIYCAGSNYNDHGREMSPDQAPVDKSQARPYFFLKSGAHCVIGPDSAVRLPRVSQKVDWEAEFAVVIGRKARNLSVADAMSCVGGYTIMNDLSARDLARRPDWPRFNNDWFGHKNFETSAPLGPWIVPADQIPDPYACSLRLWVNDEKMQDATVDQLIFDVAQMIAYLSERLTLLPGDVIATGTPAGVGRGRGIFLKPGDEVRIEVSGIGELRNPVEAGD